MCGFVVEIVKDFNSLSVNEEKMSLIKKMTYEISHRGPDSTKFVRGDWYLGGFNRLSIQDISERSDQPFYSNDKRFLIFFNGEIYNKDEIKQRLSKFNINWKTSGDTEVLLNSFIFYGKEVLNFIRGMFAFVIIDTLKKSVFIARDHLGIKPLYYYETETSFFCSSEIKPIKFVNKFERNDQVIFEQIKFRYVAGRNTIFKNIFRLNAGELCEINQNGTNFQKYFNISNTFKNRNTLDLENIKFNLDNSIKSHLLSDVGFVVQLSGGLDSSYITAFLSSHLSGKVNTISVRVKDEQFNEKKYQDYISNRYKTNHNYIELGENELYENFNRFSYFMDIPIIHISCVFLFILSKEISKQHKVVLTGEGSDELFGGYSWLTLNKTFKFLKYLESKGLNSDFIPQITNKMTTLKKMLSLKLYEIGQSSFEDELIYKLMPDVKKNLKSRSIVVSDVKNIDDQNFILAQECYLQSMLERQDRASMASGVEARVPFCDVNLIQLVNSISYNHKINNKTSKYLFKMICETYFDKSFVYRKKNGFNLPFGKWLRNKNKMGNFLDLLTDKTFRERGIFNYNLVNKLVDEHLSFKHDYGKILINLISFEQWHRCHVD